MDDQLWSKSKLNASCWERREQSTELCEDPSVQFPSACKI